MSAAFDFDLCIIGLGPAGATLARLLADSGLHVAAIDRKSDRPDSFRKPCGGLIAPDAQKALARYALSLPGAVLASPQIFSVRTLDLDTGLSRHYRRFYLNTDRDRFDRWLISLIGPRVRVFSGMRCTALSRLTQGGFSVSFAPDGSAGAPAQVLTCRQLVGADGAHSLVRQLLPARPIRQYVCIQQYFPDPSALPYYSAIFDSTLTDCYAWSDSKDGVFILGAALPVQGCRSAFSALRDKLAAQGLSFLREPPLHTEACLVNRPASPRAFSLCEAGAFLIGEAAGLVSPSSLEGISSAMESARLLAKALHNRRPEAAYRRAVFPLCLKLTLKLLKCPFLYWPRLRALVMKSGLTAIAVHSSPEQALPRTDAPGPADERPDPETEEVLP